MESGVEFIAADMPEANRLTIHILAAVAEHERETISQRTKAALQAAKVRGTKLGSPQPKKGAAVRSQVLQAKADCFAASVLPVIWRLQDEGVTSYKALARALNARGIHTANQRKWYGSTVKNVLRRAAIAIPNAKPPTLQEESQCFTYAEALPEGFDRLAGGCS
jgi:DNA invertase Pin-like site-specific DNA recombinase